jgi:hypothetical protein
MLPPAAESANGAAPSAGNRGFLRPHLAVCDRADGLAAIRDPGVTMALWRRGVPAGLAEALDGWPDADWTNLRLSTTPDQVTTDAAAAGPLLPDVAALVRLYADLVGCPVVTLRLERVTGAGCKFLHVDYVGVRLLCTYRGPGTQWVPDEAARRDGLGTCDNAAVLPDARRLRRMSAGDVGLLKGESWPGNRGRGLIHRSPPARPGVARLVLYLDHEEH